MLLGFAGYELVSGTAIVTERRRSGYSGYERQSSYTVTRAEDPMTFWGEVVVGAGGGLYLLYRTMRGEAD